MSRHFDFRKSSIFEVAQQRCEDNYGSVHMPTEFLGDLGRVICSVLSGMRDETLYSKRKCGGVKGAKKVMERSVLALRKGIGEHPFEDFPDEFCIGYGSKTPSIEQYVHECISATSDFETVAEIVLAGSQEFVDLPGRRIPSNEYRQILERFSLE